MSKKKLLLTALIFFRLSILEMWIFTLKNVMPLYYKSNVLIHVRTIQTITAAEKKKGQYINC